MKRVFVTALCISLMASIGFSQVRKPNPKPTAKPVIITITELSSAEWNEITTSLEAEDWDKTALLSGNFLKKLKTENDKKQLARLRYFYLFALAGKVSQGKMTNSELQNIAQTFIGKDFITLDRNVLNNCDKSLNYVCPSKNSTKTVRITATNKAFTSIHTLETIQLFQPFDFTRNNLKNVFVGGILRSIELNLEKDKVWIMRLNFDSGWVQIVDKK